MINVFKNTNEFGYHFEFKLDNGSIHIMFAGNLDLYWYCVSNAKELSQPIRFTITKENYFIYSLFDELFTDIKKTNIYVNPENKDNNKMNQSVKDSLKHNREVLFRNNTVEWHSDDFEYDSASILKTEQKDDSFVVIFERSKEECTFNTYSVRIRNSGSRYDPFNNIFMRMYHELINYEPNYHQTHIEEYTFQKRLEKTWKQE